MRGYATAAVLLILVLILFVIARLLARPPSSKPSLPATPPALVAVHADPRRGLPPPLHHRSPRNPREPPAVPSRRHGGRRPRARRLDPGRHRARRRRPGVRRDRGLRLDLGVRRSSRPGSPQVRRPSACRSPSTSRGSSQGRKDFANGVTDFGDSDIPYQGVDPTTGQTDASTRAVRLPAGRRRRHRLHLPPDRGRTPGHEPTAVGRDHQPRSSPTRSPTGPTRRSPRRTAATHCPRRRSNRSSGRTARARPHSSRCGWTSSTRRSGDPSTAEGRPDVDLPPPGQPDRRRPGRRSHEHDQGLRRRGRDRVLEYSYPLQAALPGGVRREQVGLLRPADAVQRRGRPHPGQHRRLQQERYVQPKRRAGQQLPDPGPRQGLHRTRIRAPTRSRRTPT